MLLHPIPEQAELSLSEGLAGTRRRLQCLLHVYSYPTPNCHKLLQLCGSTIVTMQHECFPNTFQLVSTSTSVLLTHCQIRLSGNLPLIVELLKLHLLSAVRATANPQLMLKKLKILIVQEYVELGYRCRFRSHFVSGIPSEWPSAFTTCSSDTVNMGRELHQFL